MVSCSTSEESALKQAKALSIWDARGNQTTLGELLEQQTSNVTRTLIVFIRHFFCGNCQEYVRRLATDLTPSILPKDLSVIVIGCGAPSLISSYVEVTSCPFPLFADPTTQLYKYLGMQRSLSLGSKDPAYIHHSLASGMVKSVMQGLKRIPTGDVGRAGDLSVNGGEFLFICDKWSNWMISWSHCMANSRDHTEIDDLKIQLGMACPCPSAEDKTTFTDAVCLKSCIMNNTIQKSTSSQRCSWIAKASQVGRSSSIKNRLLHVS